MSSNVLNDCDNGIEEEPGNDDLQTASLSGSGSGSGSGSVSPVLQSERPCFESRSISPVHHYSRCPIITTSVKDEGLSRSISPILFRSCRIENHMFDSVRRVLDFASLSPCHPISSQSTDLSEIDPIMSSEHTLNATFSMSLALSSQNGGAAVASLDNDESSSIDSACSVCYDILPSKSNRVYTVCGHLFCVKCILIWNEQKNSCPICRKELIENVGGDDNVDYESEEGEWGVDDGNGVGMDVGGGGGAGGGRQGDGGVWAVHDGAAGGFADADADGRYIEIISDNNRYNYINNNNINQYYEMRYENNGNDEPIRNIVNIINNVIHQRGGRAVIPEYIFENGRFVRQQDHERVREQGGQERVQGGQERVQGEQGRMQGQVQHVRRPMIDDYLYDDDGILWTGNAAQDDQVIPLPRTEVYHLGLSRNLAYTAIINYMYQRVMFTNIQFDGSIGHTLIRRSQYLRRPIHNIGRGQFYEFVMKTSDHRMETNIFGFISDIKLIEVDAREGDDESSSSWESTHEYAFEIEYYDPLWIENDNETSAYDEINRCFNLNHFMRQTLRFSEIRRLYHIWGFEWFEL